MNDSIKQQIYTEYKLDNMLKKLSCKDEVSHYYNVSRSFFRKYREELYHNDNIVKLDLDIQIKINSRLYTMLTNVDSNQRCFILKNISNYLHPLSK